MAYHEPSFLPLSKDTRMVGSYRQTDKGQFSHPENLMYVSPIQAQLIAWKLSEYTILSSEIKACLPNCISKSACWTEFLNVIARC